MERLFLTRTQNNWIEGPLTQDEVRSRLERGLLTTSDEISAAAGYWFFLHERDEVMKWLGRPLKQLEDEADDMTATMTKTVPLDRDGRVMEDSLMEEDEPTDPLGSFAQGMRKSEGDVPKGSVATAPSKTAAKTPSPHARLVKPEITEEQYSVETPSYWRWLSVIFVVLLGFVVYRVFGLTKLLEALGLR